MATAIAPSVLLQASSFLPGVVVTRSLRFGAPWGSLAHAKAHTHTLSRTRVGGGLTGYPIKRKWHYPRTYCCADFSFYYTKQSAASGREKPHGLLRRSPRSWRSWRWSWWRSNCGSINIICVCLCDTSSSDPLAPSQHLKPHPLTAHLAVAIYGRTPENSTHSCGESSAKGGGSTLIGFQAIVFGCDELWMVGSRKGGGEGARIWSLSTLRARFIIPLAKNNKSVKWPQEILPLHYNKIIFLMQDSRVFAVHISRLQEECCTLFLNTTLKDATTNYYFFTLFVHLHALQFSTIVLKRTPNYFIILLVQHA